MKWQCSTVCVGVSEIADGEIEKKICIWIGSFYARAVGIKKSSPPNMFYFYEALFLNLLDISINFEINMHPPLWKIPL